MTTTDRTVHDAVRGGARKGYAADRLDDLSAFLFRGLVYARIREDPIPDAWHPVPATGSSPSPPAAAAPCRISCMPPDQAGAADLDRAHVAFGRPRCGAVRYLPDHESFFRISGDGADRRNIADFDHFHVAPRPGLPGYLVDRGTRIGATVTREAVGAGNAELIRLTLPDSLPGRCHAHRADRRR